MKLFISDLHLDASRPQTAEAFFRFLRERAPAAESLYILGDLFELWVGDDDDSPLAAQVKEALRKLSEAGTQVYLMHGNRDFLIGDRFAAEAGCSLLPDPTLMQAGDSRVLLMHGDSLCSDDSEYQAFRQQVRQPAWIENVMSRSLEERRAFGRQLRQQSQSMNSRKAEDIMDVNAEAVVEAMERYDADMLVHGHTHRPGRHSLQLGKHQAERIVLGDWDSHAWCLEWHPDRSELQSWPID